MMRQFRYVVYVLAVLSLGLLAQGRAVAGTLPPANDPSFFQSGYFDVYTALSKPGLRFASRNCQLDFTVHGTDCDLSCWASISPAMAISVDGGPFQMTGPSALKVWTTVPVFFDLPDADHTVVIKQAGSNLQGLVIDLANPLVIQGQAPGIAAPSVTDPVNWGQKQYLLADTTGITPYVSADGNTFQARADAYGYPFVLASDTYADGSLVFRATGSGVLAWMMQDGSTWQARDVLHGRNLPAVPLPNTRQFGWVRLASGLNPGEEHLLLLTQLTRSNLSTVYALMFPQGQLSTARPFPPRKLFEAIGNSIVAADPLPDISPVYYQNMAQSRNYGIVSRGRGGTTFKRFPGNPNASYDAGSVEARLREITTVQPDICVLDCFTLDMSIGSQLTPAETPATLQAALTGDLTMLLAQCPNTQFYVMSILNRINWTGKIPPWNAAIQAAVTAQGSSRCVYVNQTNWLLPYTADLVDGLHPSARGYTKIANQLSPLVFGTISK